MAFQLLGDLQGDPSISAQMALVDTIEGLPTMARLLGAEGPPSELDDGVAPKSLGVIDAHGNLVGELMLWIERGVVESIEQTWYTEDLPTSIPGIDFVAVDGSGLDVCEN